jgi:hypothetical protein
MKTYYLILPTPTGIFMCNTDYTSWQGREKKELISKDLDSAKSEASALFTENRTKQLSYVDHRFTQTKKAELTESFPKVFKIFEEIVHTINA